MRAIREALGIDQESLAARCKVTSAYVSMIESSARQPSPQVSRALATELGVPLDAITYPWPALAEGGKEGEPLAEVAS